MGFPLLHGAAYMDGWVVEHVQGGKCFAYKVGEPSTDLIMTSCDEVALLPVQCMTYRECGVVSITAGMETWGIYSVA